MWPWKQCWLSPLAWRISVTSFITILWTKERFPESPWPSPLTYDLETFWAPHSHMGNISAKFHHCNPNPNPRWWILMSDKTLKYSCKAELGDEYSWVPVACAPSWPHHFRQRCNDSSWWRQAARPQQTHSLYDTHGSQTYAVHTDKYHSSPFCYDKWLFTVSTN